ncbi:MAG TPA: amidase [Paracoccaceae bacterium]|nr:amidase [Paracoccaceae bacterium]
MAERGIDAETIAAAERVMGVEYTPEERAAMLDNLEGQIAAAAARRATPFPNDLPTASRFDPRLPGFAPPPAPQPGGRQPMQAGPCPTEEADLAFATVAELSRWIARGELTSARITEVYLSRIERLGPALECFVTVVPDQARAEAAAADAEIAAGRRRGPLHGIPYGLKDLFDVAGGRTTWGATPYRDRVAERDSAVAATLREAGAVLLGKTTTGAIAYGDIWFGGTTRNPWNAEEGASGSSAGSASAAAAGLIGFGIGTETLGSITSPSQRCGTTGLRPTFGRVSRAGAMALCWSLDKVGPICRGVEDCALVLETLQGFDPADRGSLEAPPFAFDPTAGIEGLRLGYLPAAFEDPGATDVDRAALEAATSLAGGIKAVELPDLPYGALMAILYAEAAAAFEDLTLTDRDDEMRWQASGAWPNTWRKARFLSAVDHVQADRLRYRVMQALDAAFREVDVLIGPFMTGPMLVASNFTGHPCLHLRAGFDRVASRSEASLSDARLSVGEATQGERFEVPQGISLWGGLFDEARVLAFGLALEERLKVRERRPPL